MFDKHTIACITRQNKSVKWVKKKKEQKHSNKNQKTEQYT